MSTVMALILFKTYVVSSQHVPAPGWIIKEDMILVTLVYIPYI